MKHLMLCTITLAALLTACGPKDKPAPKVQQVETTTPIVETPEPTYEAAKVTVPLVNNSQIKIGTVTVSGDGSGGVRLLVNANAIPEGAHGMHFHEKADCSAADFKSAGGHINPMNKQHGLENADGPDNADMENAVAPVSGLLKLERMNDRVSMTGGGGLPALLDADGSALVIHANPDDQMTQPIGGAGARIACAEITR